ncbi:MAG: tetratricopeptide repeat protein [Calditrichaeota bacterium]|nr:tetratricopeptide repeat protein [Calditrichota bacterium]
MLRDFRWASALKASLTPEEKGYIEQKPTENLEAYDFYLRALDYYDQSNFRIAAQMFEKAVALDPSFALAYAALSWTNTYVYWVHVDHTPERLGKAKTAVDQALALEPDLPEAHFALGRYYYHGYLDYDRALEQFTIALKGMPNHAHTRAYIGYVQRRQGKFEQALANQLKPYDLDPRSARLANDLANTYRLLRRYPEAERYYNRAIALRPDSFGSYSNKVWLYVRWEGNIRKARRVLDEAIPNLENAADPQLFRERARLNMFDRNYPAALEQLAYAPSELNLAQSLLYAQIYKLTGQGDLARAYYDSARVLVEAGLKEDPVNPGYYSDLGIACAGLGRKEEALRAGQKGVALLPISQDALRGYTREVDLAIIYTMVSENEAAIDKLAYLLSIPGDLSVPLLKLDPTWDPLREHPRFKALVEKYGG